MLLCQGMVNKPLPPTLTHPIHLTHAQKHTYLSRMHQMTKSPCPRALNRRFSFGGIAEKRNEKGVKIYLSGLIYRFKYQSHEIITLVKKPSIFVVAT